MIILFSTSLVSRPMAEAMLYTLSGLNVPSVSMKRADPSRPPCSTGNWKLEKLKSSLQSEQHEEG